MLELRACPKCGGGDMGIDKDVYGWFRQCIQCGYLKDLTVEEVLAIKKATVVAASKEAA